MISSWFDAREAAELGTALADRYAHKPDSSAAIPREALQEILDRADAELRALNLNFYKKAKFANSFKWRLLEKGFARESADAVTEALVLHLSRAQVTTALSENPAATSADRPRAGGVRDLLTQGNKYLAQGALTEAIDIYQALLKLNPRHAEALNNLGAALFKMGRYREAEQRFRHVAQRFPDFADAQCNLGNLLRCRGHMAEAEVWLRSAVKLNPKHVDARNNLGFTLVFLGRLSEASSQFKKALKAAPRNADALFGLGHVAAIEGDFDEAETFFNRALEVAPKMPSAWAALSSLHKMTTSDAAWLESAEQIAASGIAPVEEADLRFAIGKYCDDVGDFKHAFESYERANELQKTLAVNYDPAARTHFVDDMMRAYTPAIVSCVEPVVSNSMKPVLVVGMPRSGTSLVEQIIASHPAAKGAGEMGFWNAAIHENELAIRHGTLDESTKKKLAEGYLRELQGRTGDAVRIVDKAPVNSDYLGLIHSVFPNARMIYMRRDPIDTCLSCYFQKFSADLDFAMDLSDLAHYYKEHRRLMLHWCAVLPPGTILEVPYSDLVADQEKWTRKILDFLGLEWDEACLDYHKTNRPVVTASYWQVRQPIFKNSVARWRSYKKFIGPLLELKN
jgi:tetratricopeptide (TPR) repeat protein